MTLTPSLKSPSRKKDTSLPVSSLIIFNRPESDRATHSKIGRDAEKRVADFLSKIYGSRNVVFQSSLASGTNGRPDVLLKQDPPILIEVKTCTLFHRKRIFGAAKTFIHSWKRLSQYAESRLMRRIMVIEYRHKGEYIYVWIKGQNVDQMLADRLETTDNKIEVFHFDFRQALIAGDILTDKGFDAEKIVSPQKRIDVF